MEKLNLSNIINREAFEIGIEECSKNIDCVNEEVRARIKWRIIIRSEKLNFICKRCSKNVKAYAVDYDCILANYRRLLPFTLNCTNENLDLIDIITRYTRDMIIDSYGGVWFDIKLSYGSLMDLKQNLEEYWKTHPLCSTKVDKYRRIVSEALDSDIYR